MKLQTLLAASALCLALFHFLFLLREDLVSRTLSPFHVAGLAAALGLWRAALDNPWLFHGGMGFDVLAPLAVLVLFFFKLRGRLRLGGGDLKLMFCVSAAGGTWALCAMQAGAFLWSLAWLGLGRIRKPGHGWRFLARLRIPLAPGFCAGLMFFFCISGIWPQTGVKPEPDTAMENPGLEPGLGSASLDPALAEALKTRKIQALECPRQALADMIRALGSRGGLSFLCDESVKGEAAWYFPAGSLWQALESFLVQQRLHVRTESGVLVVSRMAWKALGGDRFSFEAEGVQAGILIAAAARLWGTSILGLEIPDRKITIHGFSGGLENFLTLLLPADGTLRLRHEDLAWFVERAGPVDSKGSQDVGRFKAGRDGENWRLDLERAGLDQVMKELGRLGGFEYVFAQKPGQILEDIHLSGMDLGNLLGVLCGLSGQDYVKDDQGRYRFFESARKDLFRKALDFEVISFHELGVQDALQFLPQDFAAQASWRVDKNNNALLLYGSQRERDLMRPLLLAMDRPCTGRHWHTFEIRNMGVKDALARLPGEFPAQEALVLESRNAFMMRLTKEAETRLGAFLKELDRAPRALSVSLKFLSPEDVMALLPSGFSKNDLSPGRNNTLYYTGPAGRFGELKEVLAVMDVPEPQIRYQILVVEYLENETVSVNSGSESGLGFRPGKEGDSPSVLDSLSLFLGGASNLSFDVLGSFGSTFTLNLDAKLNSKKARILTDTTLQGLSGQDLKFQNSQTYRIAETKTDPDSGEVVATGATREITSGLFLGIKGTVSGDGMITMSLSATMSERGGDESDSSGANPLSTSERIINTRVRTPSGQPLVVGGLIKSTTTSAKGGLPFIAGIPGLGDLLSSSKPSRDYSEISIYIMPSVEYGLAEPDQEKLDEAEFTARFSSLTASLPAPAESVKEGQP